MISKFTVFILSLFSLMLAFGVVDPVFGIRASFGLTDFLAAFLVAICFAFYPNKIIKINNLNTFYLLLILFILFFSATIYGYSSYDKDAFNFKFLICILIYFSLSFLYKKEPMYIHYSLLAFSIGAFLFVVLLSTVYSTNVEFHKGRIIVFGENPNSTSARFSIAVIFLVYVFINNPFRFPMLRYVAILMSLPIMYMILQSGSRGSVVSVIVSCFILIYFSSIGKLYKGFITLGLVLAFPYVINVIVNAGSISDRLVDSFESGDLAGRDKIWSAALEVIYKNPFIGVGEAGYFQEIRKITGRYIDTHNLILYIFATGGIISLTLFLFFYKNLFVNAFYYFRRQDVLPIVLLLNVTLIALKTGGALTYMIMWVVFAMVSSYSGRLSRPLAKVPVH